MEGRGISNVALELYLINPTLRSMNNYAESLKSVAGRINREKI